jgi:hypothetical protein
MSFTRMEWMLVDETLSFVKPHLRELRKAHGVTGDVTYAIDYDGNGAILGIQILAAPPDMTPEFADAARRLLGDRLRIPRSTETGVLHFTDLGLDAPAAKAASINDAADAEREAEREVTRKKENRIALWLAVGTTLLGVLSGLVGAFTGH